MGSESGPWTFDARRSTIPWVPSADEETARESPAERDPSAPAGADIDGAAMEAEPSSATAEQPVEILPPPALIVRLRAPDRAVARIIGEMTPEHARLGAVITFGLSEQGRQAERAEQAHVAASRSPDNTLSAPHPRLDPLPTRVATKTSFRGGASNDA
jgi:hypothetical protein